MVRAVVRRLAGSRALALSSTMSSLQPSMAPPAFPRLSGPTVKIVAVAFQSLTRVVLRRLPW
jgi:hypothetical protein